MYPIHSAMKKNISTCPIRGAMKNMSVLIELVETGRETNNKHTITYR